MHSTDDQRRHSLSETSYSNRGSRHFPLRKPAPSSEAIVEDQPRSRQVTESEIGGHLVNKPAVVSNNYMFATPVRAQKPSVTLESSIKTSASPQARSGLKHVAVSSNVCCIELQVEDSSEHKATPAPRDYTETAEASPCKFEL